MKARAGFTLIELMVTAALLGIAAGTAVVAVNAQQARAIERVLAEKAMQVLEYHATLVLEKKPADPAVKDRLLGELPQGRLEIVPARDTVTVAVTWRAPGGRTARRELTLLGALP